ncbi:zinc ABC transporter substrate-binding protein [Parendozoicomonas haliclonae]|uniref:Manganese ABC transporter substrate-binding lipoprotein n=2 Tax=Parendozoicomonas haliclonae TaxID=1960125 RepID=A0A1X7AGR3_9GAMM|nr:Manganese ABC transporter substrate-binding lipoprotein precursor [Parendozoicomonas haliclonae]
MRIASNWVFRETSRLGFAAVLLAGSIQAQADLRVFACEPEWAALAQELSPRSVVYSATTAQQDPHQVQPRPGLISKMRKADLVVCSGAELEVGWLPVLQQKSGNRKVQSRDEGLFFAADYVETIDKAESTGPLAGDIHEDGNPHLHLDPYRILDISKALAERMANLDPASAKIYRDNQSAFADRWQAQIETWEKQAEPLKGLNLIAYHSNFDYLLNWLGINTVGDLEPKPGVPPSSRHLASLLQKSQSLQVDGVIYASYQNAQGADWLSKKLGVPNVELPMSVGGNEDSHDLTGLYGSLIQTLLKTVTGSSS